MIINNTKNNIYVSVIEDIGISNATYSVYSVDARGCVNPVATLTGELDADNRTDLILSDGIYVITVFTEDEQFPTIEQEFIVYYNFIPQLIEYTNNALCKGEGSLCTSCKTENELEDLFKDYFKTMTYLSCTGILPNLKLLRHKSCEITKVVNTQEEMYKYFGRFNFDYKRELKTFFAHLYIELYYDFTNIIENSETPEEDVFEFEKIERCIYNQGFDYVKTISLLNNLNCEC